MIRPRNRIPAQPPDPAVALVIGLLAFAATLFARQVLNDSDTYWHIRAGEWMLDHRALLTFDPFSYTFAGRPWQTHEWLSEIILALAYRGAGWSAVVLLTAACFAATGALLAWHISRFFSRPATILTTVIALASIAPSLLARPHILALPLFGAWTAGLVLARSRRRPPSLALVVVIVLWANLHASFILGLVLAVAFAFEAALEEERRWATLQAWAPFLGLSVVGALCTPYGLAGLLFPLKLNAMPSLAFVSEWQPTDLKHLQAFELGMCFLIYIAISRRVWPGVVRAMMLIVLTYLAFAHARHQMLLAVVAPLIIAEPCAAVLGRTIPAVSPRSIGIAASITVVAAVVLAGARLVSPIVRTDAITSPVSALSHVPPGLSRTAVLNDYAFGGYLIFQDVKPFVDSRAELYGNDWLKGYAGLLSAPASSLRQSLDRRGVRWTIFAAQNPIVAKLDALPGWKRLYSDKWAVVQVRAAELTAVKNAQVPGRRSLPARFHDRPVG